MLGSVMVLALIAGSVPGVAQAEESDGGASWHLEQPSPPELPSGLKGASPIGLGSVTDIEFWAPNRGLLITAGNPPTIPAGIWAYNGIGWHELASVCGATDGRIAWAGPEDFWTVSDGRPGQASSEGTPPLADNTLCHFVAGQVVGSYASLAFRPGSYQAMHGAACPTSSDCWFGGDPLPDGQVGAFHLHWDGQSISAVPSPQGRAVEDMRSYANRLYESVRVQRTDQLGETESPSEPSLLHLIEPNGVEPTFVSLFPETAPIYAEGEAPEALDFVRLSSDQEALWGVADPTREPEESNLGQVTVLRDLGGSWTQLLGADSDPEGTNPFTKEPGESTKNELVEAIAAEPPDSSEAVLGEESAWVALSSREDVSREPLAPASVARISGEGTVSERQSLPTAQEAQEGVGPKGIAETIACPAPHDCWLATSKGWLFHLAPEGERQQPQDTDPAFSSLINYRPPDAGIPAIEPDALPVDDSGLLGEKPTALTTLSETPEAKITVPLLSDVSTHLRHGTTLELRFHLAVRARVRLLAKRHGNVVARTAQRTLAAGKRRLLLRLNPKRWPTHLDLQTHALAKLPTESPQAHRPAKSNTISTRFAVLPGAALNSGLGPLG